MIKEFNLKFRIELRWPFAIKKVYKEDQPSPTRESNILLTPGDVTIISEEVKDEIKNLDGIKLTKNGLPDKRYRGYWKNLEATGLGNHPVPKKLLPKKQQQMGRGVNYFKTIELRHEGMTVKEISKKLNISQPRVSQLWKEYIKSTPTHKKMYSKESHQSVSRSKHKYTIYDKKFIADAVTQALDTSRSEVRKLYNLPEATLRQWIQRSERSIQENKE